MRLAVCLALLVGVPVRLPAQDLAGSWSGVWIRDADTLDVVMRFENAAAAWSGTFDTERLRVEGIPFTEVAFDPPIVRLRLVGDTTTTEFEGRVVGDSLSGALVEDGASGWFAFARTSEAPPALREEEVRFRNGDVELAGTLVLPAGAGPHPAVVFLHGSGSEGRWASRFLARRLARDGIAALIYDKRGVGGSGGSWEESGIEDLAADAAAAVGFARTRAEIDPHRVGIHGHSQGGTIAPLAAVRSEADFVIGSAAAGVSMADVEAYSIGNSIGVSSLPPDEVALARDYVEAIVDVAYRGAPREELEAAAARAEGYAWYFAPPRPDDPYWAFSRRFAEFDPLLWWARIRVPVLLVYGSEDARVPAEVSRAAIVQALGDRAPVVTRVFEGADHTFRVRRPGDVWPRTVEGYPDVILEWLRNVAGRETSRLSSDSQNSSRDRLALPLQVELPRLELPEILAAGFVGGLRDQSLARRGHGRETRGHVDVVAQGGDVADGLFHAGDSADVRNARVNADADGKPGALLLGVPGRQQQSLGSEHRRPCVVGSGEDRKVQTDHLVTDQFVDDGIGPDEDLGRRLVEPVHQLTEARRGHPLRHLGRPANIDEEHGDFKLGTTRVPFGERHSKTAEARILPVLAVTDQRHEPGTRVIEGGIAVLAPVSGG